MSRKVHLIHGFNEKHRLGRPKMEVLKPHIEARGYDCAIIDYGYLDIVGVKYNANIARLIYPQIHAGDSIIAFSNGCALSARVCELGAPVESLVFVQPALRRSWTAPRQVNKVTVMYNSSDMATAASKYWSSIANIMPWHWGEEKRHKWGEMGQEGYTGSDDRYTQYDTKNTPEMPEASGHSGWLKPENSAWLQLIAASV